MTLLLGFLLATSGAALALWLADRGARGVEDRALRLLRAAAPEPGRPRSGGALRRLAGRLEPLVREGDTRRWLERLLWQAELPYTPAEFLVGSCVAGIAGAALGWALLGPAGTLGLGLGLVPAALAARRAATARKALVAQLPDALLLVVNALRSGHGLLQAMKVVATQAPAPVSREIGAVIDEINWGLAVEAALGNFAGRVRLVEVDLAVGAILVQRETGGNLAEILTNLQETLRDRARSAGEVHALTAQGRLSGWVLSLLPAGIGALFMLINPGYLLPFLADPRGRAMALGAAAAQLLGVLALRRIVSVRY